MSVIYLIITGFTFWILYEIYKAIERMYYVLQLPKPGKNFLGMVHYFRYTRVEVFHLVQDFAIKYYPIYGQTKFHVPMASLLSPDDIEQIFTNNKHNTKGPIYKILHGWLKTGLLTSEGSKWQMRRKILTNAFHFSILKDFICIFNEATDKLVDNISNELKHTNLIKLNNLIAQCTLKSIGETSMGTKIQLNTQTEMEYKKNILEIGRLYVHRIFNPWLFPKMIYFFSSIASKENQCLKILHSFTKNIIDIKDKEFQADKKDKKEAFTTRPAMLDLLFNAKSEGLIDNEGICEEVDTFMFEGHDTVTASICFTLMLIACHPKYQAELVEEMKLVLNGDLHRKPTYNDLGELKFMERFIKESLRMYPSVNYTSRYLGEDIVTKSGYFLKKHTMVQVFIYNVHHNPNNFPDPEKFDPDRFLPENSKDRHHFAFIPFSAGARNCIGQRYAILEIKAILCGILANFTLEPIDTPDTIELQVDLILRTTKQIKVKFIPKNNLT